MATATTPALNFKPLKDRVFVRYTEEIERTAGGIYVPDTAKEKPQRGRIKAIGDEVKQVNVGDQILFDKFSGAKIKVHDEEYLILKEEDILGTFVE